MKTLLAAAVIAAAPFAASASSVTPLNSTTLGLNQNASGVWSLDAGSSTASVSYSISGPMKISVIAVSGTGNTLADLSLVGFSINGGTTYNFTSYNGTGPYSSGGSIPSFYTSGGFTLTFSVAGSNGLTSGSYQLATAAVPLPATGLMLLGGLGALGVAKRRKKKADDA